MRLPRKLSTCGAHLELFTVPCLQVTMTTRSVWFLLICCELSSYSSGSAQSRRVSSSFSTACYEIGETKDRVRGVSSAVLSADLISILSCKAHLEHPSHKNSDGQEASHQSEKPMNHDLYCRDHWKQGLSLYLYLEACLSLAGES